MAYRTRNITLFCRLIPKMPSCELEVCDIEDAVKKDDLTPNDCITKRSTVLPKARARSAKNGCIESPVGDSIIPGTQKIYIKTWGCSHNNSDGEYMAGQLAAYGYKITGNLIIIRGFNKHRRLTKCVGYFAHKSWLLFFQKEEVTSKPKNIS